MSLVEKWREKVFIIKKGKEYVEENDRNTAKKLLRQLHAAQIQDSLLEEYSEISKDSSENHSYKGNAQFRIIEETLNILSRNERFVIETHLVYHHTWSETMMFFAEKSGPGCERSERTLKRIQSSALKKMVNFINLSPLKEYFHET